MCPQSISRMQGEALDPTIQYSGESGNESTLAGTVLIYCPCACCDITGLAAAECKKIRKGHVGHLDGNI